MNETTTKASGSFPLFAILGLIFITLKLTGFIAWSWWWVLSPFWIPISIFLVIFLVIFIIAFGARA